MSWIAMATLTAELPSDSGLRAAAYSLRGCGDVLAAQASVSRGVADAIGPGVWQDATSGRARAILEELCTELSDGSSAMHQAADALENLAGYVAGQQWRYEETGRLLENLALDPLATISHHELAEAGQLTDERRSIERGVSAAMGHAAELINQAASRAIRYHGTSGQSVWSRIEHDLADFASGVWDGTYAMGKGIVETVWSLGTLYAKLSPERMLIDPQGYLHDAEHAAHTVISTTDQIAHHKKQFVENLLNLSELRTDPVHWFGELAPTIAAAVATDGASGLAAKGADMADTAAAADGAAAAADTSQLISALPDSTIEHFTDGVFNSHNDPVGFHSAPGGIAPTARRIDRVISVNSNGTYRADVSFQRADGTWERKNVGMQTMFPNSWSKADVIRAVEHAFNNRHMIPGGMWEGQYDGVTIRGYMQNGMPVTAFPAPIQ